MVPNCSLVGLEVALMKTLVTITTSEDKNGIMSKYNGVRTFHDCCRLYKKIAPNLNTCLVKLSLLYFENTWRYLLTISWVAIKVQTFAVQNVGWKCHLQMPIFGLHVLTVSHMGLSATSKCAVHPFLLVVLRNNCRVTVKKHEHISGVQHRAVTGGFLWYQLMMLLLYMAVWWINTKDLTIIFYSWA